MAFNLFFAVSLVAFLSLAPGSSVAFVEVDFSTSIPHWTGHPFTATCTLGNYTDEGILDYRVKFYRSVDSVPLLIGTHLVRAHNASIESHVFLPEVSKDLVVHSGSNYSYPVFSVTVTPKRNANASNYWCVFQEIADWSINPNHELNQVSNVWYNIPQLTFTATRRSQLAHLLKLSCTIVNFTPGGASYSVKFRLLNNLRKDEYLLGSFDAVEGRSIEFTQGDFQGIAVGQLIELPTFELLTDFDSEYSYWCELITYRNASQALNQVTKSNVVLE